METVYSADSPEFWLHHSMLDNLWNTRQNRRLQNIFEGYEDKEIRLLGSSVYRHHYIDNSNLGKCGEKIKYQNVFPVAP